jgi:hypothetical protein
MQFLRADLVPAIHYEAGSAKNAAPFFWRDPVGEPRRGPTEFALFALDGSSPVPATWGFSQPPID